MSKYRILSLDGGGIRGLITAILLDRLNKEKGIEGWLGKVDMLAGTSTGGILALGMAYGKTPEEIASLYISKCQHRLEFAAFHRFNFAGFMQKISQN